MDVPRRAVIALLALALTGCATAPPDGAGRAAGSTTATPSGVAVNPSPMPTPSSGGTPSGAGRSDGDVTLTGRVELLEIEGGCLVLRVGSEGYQLLGVDRQTARPGSTVTVRGRVRSDVVTTCMVGPVLQVTEIRPA